MQTRTVSLTLPASSDYVRIARLASSGVAERLGFDFEAVDELRIAVDELCHAAIDHGAQGSIMVCFDLHDHAVDVELRVSAVRDGPGRGPGAFDLTPLSRQILGAIVDSADSGCSDDEEWFRFHKGAQR